MMGALSLMLATMLGGATPTKADSPVNAIHPTFPLLDAHGNKTIESELPTSTNTTCGNCHDTGFIDSHNGHQSDTVRASCIQCHFAEGKWPEGEEIVDENGVIKREFVSISAPSPSNCALCHGTIHTDPSPLTLPNDFGRTRAQSKQTNFYDLTKWTGEIISGQKMRDSYLNLANKDARDGFWDVHAARLVQCNACHHSRNNPQKMEIAGEHLPFLLRDPRRLSLSEYLHQPDHRLSNEPCTRCHDALATHDGLPYPKRHMERLDCRSCHTPRPMGPAWQTVDSTVLRNNGEPRVAYRGVDDDDPTHFSAVYLSGYSPFLLWEKRADGKRQLAPHNLVTHYEWVSGETETEVSIELLRTVFLDDGSYSNEVIAALDSNRDGVLAWGELRLDSETKVSMIKEALVAAGVSDPKIRARISPRKIHHGVQEKSLGAYECASCHKNESRINEPILLADYSIPSAVVTIAAADRELLTGTIDTMEGGGLVLMRSSRGEAHILGHDRAPWSDALGFALFLLTVVSIGVHGGLRVRGRRQSSPHPVPTKTEYLYSLYERIWHWLMAVSILLLVLTGIQIHWVNESSWLSFTDAVWLHNILAAVMIVNAFFSLFYHLATADIKQFIPSGASLLSDIVKQGKYYLNGIFVGAPHPIEKSKQRKLNPLQQLTYMMLLNVLFPFQVITGALMWGVSRWPGLSEQLGGLTLVTPLHNFGAWLLVSFIVAHVYLTTTGHSVFSNIRAMATGYDEIEIKPTHENG